MNYGICFQSIVPVRAEAAHRSEMISQLLFGEHFKIIEQSEDGAWLKIENAYDKYQGWIDKKQCRFINQQYYEILDSLPAWPMSKDLMGLMQGQNKIFPVVYGSVLPVYNEGIMLIDNEACKYQGDVFFPAKATTFEELYSVARFYLAAPYLWGGRSPMGIDCSGFTQQVYKICGYKLPRDAYQQAECGQAVLFKDAQPGDLAFFTNDKGRITHVGLLCENYNIIHASGEVRIDKLREKGIFNFDINDYSHTLHSIRRII